MRLGNLLVLSATVWLGIAASGQQPRIAVSLAPVVVEAPREYGAADFLDTPAAITLVSGAQVAAAGIISLRELSAAVPNLALSHSVARSFGDVYAIRGAANTEFFSDPAVVLYVDDVPAGGVFAYETDLLQIAWIEAWRGPQGSVFGKNSEAGVLNIVTRKPTDRFEARADASYGTFDTQRYRVGGMGPVIKGTLYFALAGEFSHSDGFLSNPLRSSHPDHQEGFNGRLSLSWIPSDGWDLSLTVTGNRFHDGVRLVPLGGNARQVPSDFDPVADSYSHSQALWISRSLPNLTLTSITAHRFFVVDPLTLDLDLSPFPGNTARIQQQESQWSEELRLQSPTDTGDWRWRAGFFFSTAQRRGDDTRELAGVPGFPQQTRFVLGEDTYAGFGQVTYAGVDRLGITLGLRLDYTSKSIDRSKTTPFGPFPTVRDRAGFFNAAPKLTLDYRLTDQLRAYGSTGLGFKPGGYSAFLDPPRSPAFQTERNWASEIGLKSSWLDDRWLATLALFHNQIHDYQVERTIPLSTDLTIFNAPEVTARGIELELLGQPVKGLELSAAFGWTDIQFNRYRDPDTGASLSGRRPPFVPEFNAQVAAQYKHRCGLFARIEYQAVGQAFFDDTNQPGLAQSSYGLLNARLGYETPRFAVCVYGRNLTDSGYFTKKLMIIEAAGVPGEPLTVGTMVSLKY